MFFHCFSEKIRLDVSSESFTRKIKLYLSKKNQALFSSIFCRLFGALRVNVSVLSNSYRSTMVCPPVRGDNPRALARGLSPV